MSQTATTSASLCWRKASSTWSPRLPRPMNPSRTRSLAPRTRKEERAAVVLRAASVRVNSRRVIGLAGCVYCIVLNLAKGRTTNSLHASKDDVERLLHGGLEILSIQLVALRIMCKVISAAGVVHIIQLDEDLVRPLIAHGGGPLDVDGVGIEISRVQLSAGIHAFDLKDVAAVRPLPFAHQLNQFR